MNMSDFPSTIGSGSPSSGAATASSTSNTVWPRPAPASRTSPSSSSNKQRGPSSEADGLVKSHQRGPSLKAGRISHTPSPPQPVSLCVSLIHMGKENPLAQKINKIKLVMTAPSIEARLEHLVLPPLFEPRRLRSRLGTIHQASFLVRLCRVLLERLVASQATKPAAAHHRHLHLQKSYCA